MELKTIILIICTALGHLAGLRLGFWIFELEERRNEKRRWVDIKKKFAEIEREADEERAAIEKKYAAIEQ